MAALELFANAARTTVTAGGTTAPAAGTVEQWTVASSAGFPAAATGTGQFRVIDVADPGDHPEIILVTDVAGTTWTVTRGVEGTTPIAHAAGFTVLAGVTAAAVESLRPPTLLNEGVTMPAQTKVDFKGAGVELVDNALGGKTVVKVTANLNSVGEELPSILGRGTGDRHLRESDGREWVATEVPSDTFSDPLTYTDDLAGHTTPVGGLTWAVNRANYWNRPAVGDGTSVVTTMAYLDQLYMSVEPPLLPATVRFDVQIDGAMFQFSIGGMGYTLDFSPWAIGGLRVTATGTGQVGFLATPAGWDYNGHYLRFELQADRATFVEGRIIDLNTNEVFTITVADPPVPVVTTNTVALSCNNGNANGSVTLHIKNFYYGDPEGVSRVWTRSGAHPFDITDTPEASPLPGYAWLSPTTFQGHIWTGAEWREFATTPPPADPFALPSLVGRYRASDLAYANGDTVAAWPDSSAAGNDLAVTTAGVMQTAGIGGLPSVVFTEATLYELPTSVPRPVTIVAVMQNTDTGQGSILFSNVAGGGTHYVGLLVGVGMRMSDGNTTYIDHALASYYDPLIMYGRVDTGGMMVGANGGKTPSGSSIALDVKRLGNWAPNGTYSMTGLVSEMLVYNAVLTDAELDTVVHQLGLSYGITTSV